MKNCVLLTVSVYTDWIDKILSKRLWLSVFWWLQQGSDFVSKLWSEKRIDTRVVHDPQRITGNLSLVVFQEILLLDREFIKEVRQLTHRNAITRRDLETQILAHMKKTGNHRVKAISVGPAPLKHTRSLNDAVGDTRGESSAHSNSSRRSEPDMRKWRNEADEVSIKTGKKR